MASATEKLENIVEGWINKVFRSELVEVLAKSRAVICSNCPHAKEKKFLKAIIPDPIQEVKGMVCELCNCPLSGKTRATAEVCPDNPPRW